MLYCNRERAAAPGTFILQTASNGQIAQRYFQKGGNTMKKLKSLLSLALVLAMVLSFAVPAMAGNDNAPPPPGADGSPIITIPGNGQVEPVSYPSNQELNRLIDVTVTCVDTQHTTNYSKNYTLNDGNYTMVPTDSEYELDVVVYATSLTGAGGFLAKYNAAVGGNHVLTSNTNSQQTVTLVYDTTTKTWGLKSKNVPPVTVLFSVTSGDHTPGTGSYSISYKASGNWPYGVSLPSDTYNHKYGDRVTLQNPSKTVIADYSGGVPGYWVFDGWSVSSDWDYYPGTDNKHYHHSNCGYYNGRWYCDKDCWYYDHSDDDCWYYHDDDDWSYLDILKYCRENGLRLSELTSDDLPLNFKSSNSSYVSSNNNNYYQPNTGSSNNPHYTSNCGHPNCTGKYCDVYYACDHDECPAEYCKYWYNNNGHVCSHPNCPDNYCKYWDDCDYYDYYYGYYRPTQTITVTGNMTVYGSWSFHAAGGTLVLSASTLASSGYKPESYTFEIYSASNSKKPVKTVTIKAGSNQYVSLDNGTYYIYAVDANVPGFELSTTVSGDVNTDGAKIVVDGDAVQVKYTCFYAEDGVELNTTDHIAYLNGFADGTVKPNDYITREQVATILYRLLTDNARTMYQSSTNNFSDVKNTRWSNTAISTMVNAEVMNGFSDDTFKPANNMTRAELVTALVKITGVSGGRTAFTDTAGHWASNAINAAASEGWVTGYADGSFDPNGYLTRAEVVTIINRVLGRNPNTVADLIDGMKTFTDNQKTTKWYYLDIQEATNGHSYKRDTDGTEYWTGLK